jgi:hypothetical protein
LWQPSASLIVIGAKRFETRSWPTSHRGPILIHAAKKPYSIMQAGSPFANALYGIPGGFSPTERLPLGCIIGVAELVDVYEISTTGLAIHSSHVEQHPTITKDEAAFGNYTAGRFAWRLTKPRRFAIPIPYRGRQQIFNVPDEVVADQMKAVAA